LYEECGLRNVVLLGLTASRCQGCNRETVSIPQPSDLHRELARTVLLKPTRLTGRELRFLRTVAGLSFIVFADYLGIAIQTVKDWERAEVLRFVNDVAVRMLVASLIGMEEKHTEIGKLLSSIRRQRSQGRVSAYWISEETNWVVAHPSPPRMSAD
jgi:DNA-binding transcriptional regulator YiaG